MKSFMPSPPPGVWLLSHIPAAAKPLRHMSALPCPERRICKADLMFGIQAWLLLRIHERSQHVRRERQGRRFPHLVLILNCHKHKTEGAIWLGKSSWSLQI